MSNNLLKADAALGETGVRSMERTNLHSPAASLPLRGKRIVVTRSVEQAGVFGDKLRRLGAIPIIFPVIRFVPLPPDLLDAALQQMGRYGWLIFTSSNAVRFFFQRADHVGLALSLPRVAAVGPATAQALHARRIELDFIPDKFTGESLAAGLGDLAGQGVLLPRAKMGRPKIVELLRAQGAEVDEVALYDTVTAVPTHKAITELEKGFDIITFASPSSVRNFLKIVADKSARTLLGQATIACIGPVTAAKAKKCGLSPSIVPDEYTMDGLIGAMANYQLRMRNEQ
ncbi:MAG: uroporphyrinogen-III synthase [Anaerolineae bacterium]